MTDEVQKKIFSRNLSDYLVINKKTQREVADAIHVSPQTFNTWCQGIALPRMGKVQLLADYFGISKSDLIEEHFSFSNAPDYTNTATPDEFENIIKKYRSLDSYGQEAVNIVLDRETARAKVLSEKDEQLKRKDARIKELESRPATLIELQDNQEAPIRILQYFRSVSAGTGQVLYDDVYSEPIAIPNIPKYRRVDYAVKVSGNSMEPLYQDGDILLVEPTCDIEVGEIGIFNVDGQGYVKKLGDGELISLNRDYGNVTLVEGSRCMGRVVDKFVVEDAK